MKEINMTFEQAYERLEAILEEMNKNQIALDKALSYYEEADRLIRFCSKKLSEAEKKIEKLVKNDAGELVLDEDNRPVKEVFTAEKQAFFHE